MVKYSDWLEAWSLLTEDSYDEIIFHIIEDRRNNQQSVEKVVDELPVKRDVTIVAHGSKQEWMDAVGRCALELKIGDTLAAPFIQYMYPWRLLGVGRGKKGVSLAHIPRAVKAGVRTVHLSEGLPDSFGLLGYALGYRRLSWKSLPAVLLTPLYALLHKPDENYYPLAEYLANPFVKRTRSVTRPVLGVAKREVLDSYAGTEKRPLLIGGFGYSAEKMAKELGISSFWATSKNREIIVDGIAHATDIQISAEDVLLSGWVSEVVSYESTVVCWARCLEPEIKVSCYSAPALSKVFGPIYRILAARTLSKIGVTVLPENQAMQDR
ncbi:hypothetical protein ACFSQZ_07015 [Rubritalea spongiae]|uniref:Uncharacterized protein n=2 Tax=Rubritalea spongiae TaxID=430797 RepID=A0ABW5E0X7_9BACT